VNYLQIALWQFEQEAIRKALDGWGWNVTHAARGLGLSRVGLQRKMRKYGIRKERKGAVAVFDEGGVYEPYPGGGRQS